MEIENPKRSFTPFHAVQDDKHLKKRNSTIWRIKAPLQTIDIYNRLRK